MTIINRQRLTSQTTNTVVAASQVQAITSLLAGSAPNAVNVGNAPLIWPSLNKYINDNNDAPAFTIIPEQPFSSVPEPQFLWNSLTPIPGESLGFATMTSPILIEANTQAEFVLFLAVFADNAHTARIDIVNAQTFAPIPSTDASVNLLDGSLDPVTSVTTDTSNPYNWQKIRYYSIPITLTAVPTDQLVRFVISFSVSNYLDNGSINTAGLAFVADFYQFVGDDEIVSAFGGLLLDEVGILNLSSTSIRVPLDLPSNTSLNISYATPEVITITEAGTYRVDINLVGTIAIAPSQVGVGLGINNTLQADMFQELIVNAVDFSTFTLSNYYVLGIGNQLSILMYSIPNLQFFFAGTGISAVLSVQRVF
ncbi:hypothetical protein MH117_18870 [Paenibacillus sp. ACRRX]|uniref:hypothetical protein n=1 Tax=Paenibacillus sp. ACRRX TaxID=2918206 RepID=UPI001EF4634D|nr:hypothetical protein [Paenibacillus sp. ACRRX]MCG7409475.1 hypothetical protein [Paenibacillus sp. ACRRX]